MKTKDDRRVMPKSADVAAREFTAHINERKRKADKTAGRTIYKCSEVSGLELRITNTTATWTLLYNVKIGDKWSKRRVQIGSFPAISPAEARKRGQALHVDIASGGDPAADKKQVAQQRQHEIDEAMTVSALFELWIKDSRMTTRKSGTDEPARMMRKDVLPHIGKLDVKNVTGRHLVTINDKVKERGARIANMTLALVRQMFGFAVDKFLIDDMPKFPAKLKENAPCDRSLKVGEIVELFTKIPAAKLINTTELALKIQLATACRIGELLIAEWDHVCLESGEWRIPAENSKTEAALTIYLSTYARGLFVRLHDLSGAQRWLFPNRSETSHADTKSITKQVRDRQRIEVIKGRSSTPDALILTGGTWTPHDLRRTAASTMQDLRVNPYTIERCLNHAAEKMAKTYVPNNPEIEMYQAWQSLGEVLAICDSEKGVELAQLAAANQKRSVQDRLTLAELVRSVKSNVVSLQRRA